MNIYIVGLNQLSDIEIDKVRSFRRTGLPLCVCVDESPDGRCFSICTMPCGTQLIKDMFSDNLSNNFCSSVFN